MFERKLHEAHMKHGIGSAAFAIAAWILTVTVWGAPPTPPQIAAGIVRLTKANPRLAQDPAALAIFAAMASGQFSTDKVDAQNVFDRSMGLNGRLKGGVAYDGVVVTEFGRTAEMQRFLELHDLVPARPSRQKIKEMAGPKEMIRIGRNRIRFVAAILNQDITEMEKVWATQDLGSAVADMNVALKALTIQQGRLASQIQLLQFNQRQDVK